MDDKLITVLQEYGLSEKEAKIYLVTLELGSAPASTIARRAGLKRVTGYALLQDLKNRGLALTVERAGVTHFQVVDPKKLSTQLQNKLDTFNACLPQLTAMTDVYSNKPKIEYFEGITGIQEMYEDLLTTPTEICSFLGYTESTPEVHDYLLTDFLPRRIKKGIHARVILSPSEENKHYAGLDKEALKESILVNDAGFTLPATEINIYGPNKIMFALFAGDELSGVIIHSSKMYQSMKSIFEVMRLTYKNKKGQK